jgi:hypothetical protein
MCRDCICNEIGRFAGHRYYRDIANVPDFGKHGISPKGNSQPFFSCLRNSESGTSFAQWLAARCTAAKSFAQKRMQFG